MKKIKTILLLTALAISLNAGGIGVYIPYSLGIEKDGIITDNNYLEYDYNYKLKNKSGLGIAFATNLGKANTFGYKFALELTHPQSENSSIEKDKYRMTNTFEFGIIKTQAIKIWLGPRIILGVEAHESSSGLEIGVAPAIGIHYNISNYLALTLDLDYKFTANIGDYYDANDEIIASYAGTENGSTVRFGVFYKFNEKFK